MYEIQHFVSRSVFLNKKGNNILVLFNFDKEMNLKDKVPVIGYSTYNDLASV
jgi:hypothetical protein